MEVIASERPRARIADPNAMNGGIAFIEKQMAAMPADIEKIKADIQQATSADAKARLEGNLAQAEAYLAELKTMKPPLVSRGVSSTMTLQEGGRDMQLMIVGRAHTDGDLFIYMPKEKILATGDAVIDWMPFFNDGYPEDWTRSPRWRSSTSTRWSWATATPSRRAISRTSAATSPTWAAA